MHLESMSLRGSPIKGEGSQLRKRKITDFLPAGGNRTPKRELTMNDSDNEEDDDIDEIESDSEIGSQEVPLLAPSEVIKFVEAFRQHLLLGKHTLTTAKSYKKLASEFSQSYDAKDKEKLVDSSMHFTKLSLRLGKISLLTALQATEEFLGRGTSVTVFPDFPKQPPTPFLIYARRNQLELKPGTTRKGWKQMDADPEGKKDAEEESKEATQKYLKALETFLATHTESGDLTKAQSDHVKGIISRKKKAYNNSTSRAKRPKVENHKEHKKIKTPFEIFVEANPDLYTDYEPEKRMRKLQKKFDKLDDFSKKMFVNLSLRNED